MIGNLVVMPGNSGDTFTAISVGAWVFVQAHFIGLWAELSAAGGTATIEFHHTNDPSLPPSSVTLLGTATLTGINDPAIQVKQDAVGLYKCAKCTAIGGGAVVTALLSI